MTAYDTRRRATEWRGRCALRSQHSPSAEHPAHSAAHVRPLPLVCLLARAARRGASTVQYSTVRGRGRGGRGGPTAQREGAQPASSSARSPRTARSLRLGTPRGRLGTLGDREALGERGRVDRHAHRVHAVVDVQRDARDRARELCLRWTRGRHGGGVRSHEEHGDGDGDGGAAAERGGRGTRGGRAGARIEVRQGPSDATSLSLS